MNFQRGSLSNKCDGLAIIPNPTGKAMPQVGGYLGDIWLFTTTNNGKNGYTILTRQEGARSDLVTVQVICYGITK